LGTTFKVKGSRSPGPLPPPFVASGGCSGGRGNVLVVAICSAAQGSSMPTGGEGRGHIVVAASLQLAMA